MNLYSVRFIDFDGREGTDSVLAPTLEEAWEEARTLPDVATVLRVEALG